MGFLDDAIREHLELKRRRGADPADIERAEREALGPVRRHPEPLEGDTHGDNALGELGSHEAEHVLGAATFDSEHTSSAEHSSADYGRFDPADGGHFSDEHTLAEPEQAAPERVPAEHLPPDTGPIERYYQPPVEAEHHEPPLPPDPAFDDPYEADPGHAHAPEAAHPPDPEDGHRIEPGPIASPSPHAAPAGPPTEEHPPPHLSQPTQEYEVRFDEEDPEGHELERHQAEHEAERHGAEHHGADDHEEDVLEETPEFLQDTPDHDRLWFEQRPPRDFDFDG